MRVRLLMVCELLMLLKVTRFDVEVITHTAVDTIAAFIDNWQPVRLEITNAEGKVIDKSKLVLKVVMALSWMVYLDEVERAVLGETPEEATVKLTCAFRGSRNEMSHMLRQVMFKSFIRLVLVLNYINKIASIQLIRQMAHAIRQNVVDKKMKISERSFTNVELPKIKSKVEEANTFLANPLQMSKVSERFQGRQQGQHQANEPWMDNNQQSESIRRQKLIKIQIANLLGSQAIQDGQVKVDHEISSMSPQRIISKMKKYQPKNSSYSTIYAEKKNNEEIRTRGQEISQEKRRKILNLPALNLRGMSKENKAQLQARIQDLYSLRGQSKTPPKQQPQKYSIYFNKIKQIYKQGNALHHKSQILINRIDKVSQFLQKRFDQFDQDAHNMLEDVGTYHLQEETNGSYKKDLLQRQTLKR